VSRVSFVVPVRDRAELLDRSLAAIHRAARSCERALEYEIVVVDDRSRDASRAVALAAGARVVGARGEPLGSLRNQGAAAATGDILVFVDADVLLGSDWLFVVLDIFADDRAAAAGAPYRAPADANWVQRTHDLVRRRVEYRRVMRWGPAGALAIRREVFETIGGFDPTLSSCEDVDICRRLRASGRNLVSDPGLEAIHCGDPATLGALFTGEVRRGASNLLVSTRSHAGGELPSLALSLVVLAALFTLAPALAIAFAGEPRWLVAAVVPLIAVIAARAASMARTGGWRQMPAALLVGAVYEAGRATALVAGGLRRTRSPRTSA
jgi:GT2 family glycosyltransferase